MFGELVNNEGNKFYKINENLDDIQEELGIILPKELKLFYKEVGYGFLKSESYRFNRIMGPQSVKNFRLRQGEFEGFTDFELYEEQEKDKIIFFEVSEGYYLSIGFSGKYKDKIYDNSIEIADSLKEFLVKYQNDEHFFE